jgi:protein-S-isoprenylcysteine O-methyltransferase Ste14
LFVAALVARAYFGWKIRRANGSSWFVKRRPSSARAGGIVLRSILFFYLMAVVIVYAINPAWLDSFAAPFPDWSRWIGVALGALGLLLLVWVHHTLGRQWSTNLQFREGHTLITNGLYHWVRHPMYTALFGFFVGLALISASWLIVLLVAVSVAVLYARIDKEEAMMTEQFGDEYREYMKCTGRFLPGLWKSKA